MIVVGIPLAGSRQADLIERFALCDNDHTAVHFVVLRAVIVFCLVIAVVSTGIAKIAGINGTGREGGKAGGEFLDD